MNDTDKQAKTKKRKAGRPPALVVKINDTPQNVARALFGVKRK